MIGERLEDGDLCLAERTDLETRHVDVADPIFVAEDRDAGEAADTEIGGEWPQNGVVGFQHVVDANRGGPVPGIGRQAGRGELSSPEVDIAVPVHCIHAHHVAVLHHDGARIGIAQDCCPGEDSVEDEVEFAGMGPDEPEHLGRCRLEFERLREVVVAVLDLAEKLCVVDRDGGLVRERLEQ